MDLLHGLLGILAGSILNPIGLVIFLGAVWLASRTHKQDYLMRVASATIAILAIAVTILTILIIAVSGDYDPSQHFGRFLGSLFLAYIATPFALGWMAGWIGGAWKRGRLRPPHSEI